MKPLAERLRPTNFDEYIGQQHLIAPGAILRNMIEGKQLSSFILWGPPGVGKTTLAKIIALQLDVPFFTLSAINSGVKEIRDVISKAQHSSFFRTISPILFIDEIHRFSKSQQDSLLLAIEKGDITLIGATTENPSFEIIKPLLSRCQVYTLESLNKTDLLHLLEQALKKDHILQKRSIEIKETDALLRYSGGDARKLLNIIEILTNTTPEEAIIIDNASITKCLQQFTAAYDKKSDIHYDVISAFIKSIRGSDPNAAIYWLARMIAGGEDPLFIARRLVISAAEDIGLANPNALLLANAAFESVQKLGWPEGRIPLSEATIYLATSPKSNSSYLAIDKALDYINQHGITKVPLHLCNAPTSLMKELGYKDGYLYPHDFPNHFIYQQYLPEEIQGEIFWVAGDNPQEQILNDRMKRIWSSAID